MTPPPTTDLLTPHGRLAVLVCERCVTLPFGSALFDSRLPRWRDANCVRFERADSSIGAEEFFAVVDRLQEGLPHRYCEIWDEAMASRLEPGLEALGAEVEDRILLMEAPLSVELSGKEVAVEEVDWRSLAALYEEWLLTDEAIARDADLLAMLMAARELRFQAVPSSAWAVRAEGRVVAMTHLMDEGSFAMIEDVYCNSEFRRRGFAGACVRAAVSAARSLGRDPVFLPTDVDGPAPEFYAALGFRRGEVVTRVLLRDRV
jgi:GNAT superfamily N-acetyltransferase